METLVSLPIPHWLADVPEAERPLARRRFLLRVAALYASEAGHATALAEQIGLAPKSLGPFVMHDSSKRVPERVARGIQAATKGVVRASLLRV